jgi:hypothetical protein
LYDYVTYQHIRDERGMQTLVHRWRKCIANGDESPYIRPRRAQKGSRGIALLILDLGARRGWVVSTTPRPLYPRETASTHCTGGWVGPRASLDVCEKSRPHRDSIANGDDYFEK